MSLYDIHLTRDAFHDLESIHAALLRTESEAAARKMLETIRKACESLRENPERGSWPDELLDFGNRKYRQLQIKPYRVIYQVIGQAVYLQLIADSRRNLAPLLARRLLQP